MGQGIGDAIRLLYSQFLLRDFMAKVVPGAVFGLALICLANSWTLGELFAEVNETQPSVAAVALGIGVAWSLAFVLQFPGFLVECLADRKVRKKGHRKFWIGHVAGRADWSEGRRQQAVERLAVIKEATGNLAAALFPILFVRGVVRDTPGDVSRLIVGGVLVAALMAASWDARQREVALQDRWQGDASPNEGQPDASPGVAAPPPGNP